MELLKVFFIVALMCASAPRRITSNPINNSNNDKLKLNDILKMIPALNVSLPQPIPYNLTTILDAANRHLNNITELSINQDQIKALMDMVQQSHVIEKIPEILSQTSNMVDAMKQFLSSQPVVGNFLSDLLAKDSVPTSDSHVKRREIRLIPRCNTDALMPLIFVPIIGPLALITIANTQNCANRTI